MNYFLFLLSDSSIGLEFCPIDASFKYGDEEPFVVNYWGDNSYLNVYWQVKADMKDFEDEDYKLKWISA